MRSVVLPLSRNGRATSLDTGSAKGRAALRTVPLGAGADKRVPHPATDRTFKVPIRRYVSTVQSVVMGLMLAQIRVDFNSGHEPCSYSSCSHSAAAGVVVNARRRQGPAQQWQSCGSVWVAARRVRGNFSGRLENPHRRRLLFALARAAFPHALEGPPPTAPAAPDRGFRIRATDADIPKREYPWCHPHRRNPAVANYQRTQTVFVGAKVPLAKTL